MDNYAAPVGRHTRIIALPHVIMVTRSKFVKTNIKQLGLQQVVLN